MHDRDAAELAACYASLGKLAMLEGRFIEYLTEARAAERLVRTLCADARFELKKTHDGEAAASAQKVEEFSPTP